MGCNGSKNDVATGNTVKNRLLHPGKKSDNGPKSNNNNNNNSSLNSIPETEGNVKDIIVNTPESPNQYFSPREGEEEDEEKEAEGFQGRDEIRLVGDEKDIQEKASEKESASLEEPNLVEEAKSELTIENKANHVGEITEEKESEDSTTIVRGINNQLKKDGD